MPHYSICDDDYGIRGERANVLLGFDDESVLVLLGKLSCGADDLVDKPSQIHRLGVELTGNGLGFAFADRTPTDTRSELGARFDRAVALSSSTVLALRAKVAWAHDWVSDPVFTAAFQMLPTASCRCRSHWSCFRSSVSCSMASPPLIYGSVPNYAAPERRTHALSVFYTITIGAAAVSPPAAGFIGDLTPAPSSSCPR